VVAAVWQKQVVREVARNRLVENSLRKVNIVGLLDSAK
jgi:hypothetical protein